MSNTKRAIAKPLYTMKDEKAAEADNLDLRGNSVDQNPNDNSQESGDADQTTPNEANAATSESEVNQDYKERWVNLKRHHDTEIHLARQRIKELEASSQASTLTPPKTEEELARFREEHPEFLAMMQTVAMQQTQGVDASRLEALEKELSETRQREAMALIKDAHPDYVEVIADPAFEAWVETQPSSVKSLVVDNSDNANSFIRALDLYKLDKGIAGKSNDTSTGKSNNMMANQSAAEAVIIPGTSKAEVGETEGRIWTREEISRIRPDMWPQLEADIELAWSEGRVR